MSKFLTGLFFVFSLIVNANFSSASMINELAPLNKACLPVAGRMLKDANASCHCPPEKLCPLDLDDWTEAKTLPPNIANICCNKPKECTFETTTLLSCGQANSFSKSEQTYCTKLSVKSDKPNDAPYKAAVTKINAINDKIAQLRQDIVGLQSNDTSAFNYNQAQLKISQIRQELQKAPVTTKNFISPVSDTLKQERIDDKTLEIECKPTTKTTFCEKKISNSCPPPDNCASESDLVVRDRQGWFASPPAACWCPTGTMFDWTDMMGGMQNGKRFYLCAIAGDCVLQNTKITMADGSEKEIQKVQVGDFVKGYMSINKVTGVTLNEDKTDLFSINDNKLIITAGHPILTRKGWKAIDPGMVVGEKTFKSEITKLEKGDELLMADETVTLVKSIEIHHLKDANKYNLAVGGDNTFTANGIVIRAFKASTTY